MTTEEENTPQNLIEQNDPNSTAAPSAALPPGVSTSSPAGYTSLQSADEPTVSAANTPNTLSNKDRYSLITGTQSAIASPLQAKPPSNAYDAIFGHQSNPAPSASLPTFGTGQPAIASQMSAIAPAAQVAGAPSIAPISMAGSSIQTPSFQLTSDKRAKKNIKPITQDDINNFYAQFARK